MTQDLLLPLFFFWCFSFFFFVIFLACFNFVQYLSFNDFVQLQERQTHLSQFLILKSPCTRKLRDSHVSDYSTFQEKLVVQVGIFITSTMRPYRLYYSAHSLIIYLHFRSWSWESCCSNC